MRTKRWRRVAAWSAVGLICCVSVRFGQSAETIADDSDLTVRTMVDVGWESLAANRAPEPGSLAARIAPSADVADNFIKLKPEEYQSSELLTARSRELADNSEAKAALARFAELRKSNWYPQVVDMRYAGDSLAAAEVVFVPKPSQGAKHVEILYLIRQGDDWKVTFDLPGDAEKVLGQRAEPAVAALQAAAEARRKELLVVVAQPLAARLPFHGTWATHYMARSVYLTFGENGEVFLLQVNSNGTSSYGLFDFHLVEDKIVIEDQSGPVSFQLEKSQYWGHDGERFESLSTTEGWRWFPGLAKNEVIYLKPVYKGDWPVRRPVVTNNRATGNSP